MKKKTIFKIVIAMLLVGIGIYVLKTKEMPTDINKQDEQRIESMQKYDVSKDKNMKDINNETDAVTTGTELVLTNRIDFINRFSTLDNGVAIANNIIPNFVQFIDTINEDCTQDNYDEYFKINEDNINTLFGINNAENFKKFYDNISAIGKVKDIESDTNTLEVLTNGANFTLIVNGTEGKAKINIHAEIYDIEKMKVSFTVR